VSARVPAAAVVAAGAVLLAACGDLGGPGEAGWHLEVTDPVGDRMLTGNILAPGADLASATIEATGDSIHISVRWAPGTFDPDSSRVTITLDLDPDPATGAGGLNAPETLDADLIGGDLLIKLGDWPAVGGPIEIMDFVGRRLNGRPDYHTTSPACCFHLATDGMDAAFASWAMRDADGDVNVEFVSTMKRSATTYSGIQDRMPDAGMLPAVLERR
jgi:hypothetical protein